MEMKERPGGGGGVKRLSRCVQCCCEPADTLTAYGRTVTFDLSDGKRGNAVIGKNEGLDSESGGLSGANALRAFIFS